MDQPQQDPGQGFLVSTSLELGYLERDVYTALYPRLGYTSEDFDLLLTAPLELLTYDIRPESRSRAFFGVLRATPYAKQGVFDPTRLSVLLASARYGQPDDFFFANAGTVEHSLGHGSTVWRTLSSPDIDHRYAGAVLKLGDELLGAEMVLGNVFAPHLFSAARGYLKPLLLFDFAPGLLLELSRRLAVGAGYAADFFAPVESNAEPEVFYGDTSQTTPIVHGLLDVEFLLTDWKSMSLALYTDLGLRRGWHNTMATGSEVGLLASSQLWTAHFFLRLGLRAGSRNYRFAEFDSFYQIERHTTLFPGAPKATLTTPSGLGWVVEAEIALAQWVRLRCQADDSPGDNNSNALVGLDLNIGPVRAGGLLAQRSFEGTHGLLQLGERTLGLAELRIEVFGPLAIVGRYWRTLRKQEHNNQGIDNDLLLGIEAGWLLN